MHLLQKSLVIINVGLFVFAYIIYGSMRLVFFCYNAIRVAVT